MTEDGVQRELPGHAPRTIAIFSTVSGFCLGGAVLILVSSLSGTGDTPCGPLVDPNFGWDGGCAISYRTATGTAIGLIILAVVSAVLAVMAAKGRPTHRPAGLVWTGAVVAAWGVYLFVRFAGAADDQPHRDLGWAGSESALLYLAAAVTVGLLVGWACLPRRPSPVQHG